MALSQALAAYGETSGSEVELDDELVPGKLPGAEDFQAVTL